MEINTDDKIKNSFQKVREDIETLKQEIEKVKGALLLRNNDILMLKEQIKSQNELILGLSDKIESISTGNERVINDALSSTMINNDDQRSPLKSFIVEKFRHLTDREFSVFLSIYQIEEEKGAATYADISKQLGTTVVSLRGYINDLINRGYPVYGERQFNRKTLFRISKEFRKQNLISEVLVIRETKNLKQKPPFSLEKQNL
ncbi:MAG: hypothetical protein AABW56_04240 [Nanoarchaeota archaeon]